MSKSKGLFTQKILCMAELYLGKGRGRDNSEHARLLRHLFAFLLLSFLSSMRLEFDIT